MTNTNEYRRIDMLKIEAIDKANEEYQRAVYSLEAWISYPEFYSSETDIAVDIRRCIRAYRRLLEATLNFPVIGVATKYW